MPMLVVACISWPSNRKGLAITCMALSRHRRRVFRPSQLGQDQGELVASKARHRIAGPHAGVEPAGDFHQQLVPSRVAEHIVDVLELVEIE